MSNILRMKTAEARSIELDLDRFELSGGKVQAMPIRVSGKSGGTEAWFDTGESLKVSARKGAQQSAIVRRKT